MSNLQSQYLVMVVISQVGLVLRAGLPINSVFGSNNLLHICTCAGLAGSIPAFNNVRGALVFSASSLPSAHSGGHVTGPRGHMTGRLPPPAVTPLAPWYANQIRLLSGKIRGCMQFWSPVI